MSNIVYEVQQYEVLHIIDYYTRTSSCNIDDLQYRISSYLVQQVLRVKNKQKCDPG